MERALVIEVKELLEDEVSHLQDIIDKNEQINEQKFEALNNTTKIALESSEKAITKAEIATEKRFESVNEFRATLSDQANNFIIRTEFDLVVDRLEQDIKNLLLARGEMLAVKSFDIAHSDLQKQVDDLKLTNARLEGKASQESVAEVSRRVMIGYIFSALGAIIAIVSLIIKFI